MNPGGAKAADAPVDSPAADEDSLPGAAGADQGLEDGLDAAHRYLKRQLAERPLTVLAIAAGVGLLLGGALAGRR